MINPNINEIAYPLDNSYSFNITDNKNTSEEELYLAGTVYEYAKPVTIVSGQYLLTVTNVLGKSVMHAFRTVLYKGKLYRVLDRFAGTPPEIPQWIDYPTTIQP